MTFSERYNIVVRRLTLQHDDMNRDLRIALWNAFCVSYYARDCRIGTYPWIQYLTAMIYGRFFRRSMVELPPYTRKVREEVRVFFLKQEWFRIYDFLEFVYSLQIDRDGRPIAALEEMAAQFSVECNRALEENLSAYRMVHGRIEEIGAEMEQSILQDLVQDVEDSFGAARRDFWSSYEYISNKSHPDVKQAVSVCLRALDAIAQKVLNDPATRLSDIIDILDLDSRMILALKTLFNARREGDLYQNALTESTRVDYKDIRMFMGMAGSLAMYLMQQDAQHLRQKKSYEREALQRDAEARRQLAAGVVTQSSHPSQPSYSSSAASSSASSASSPSSAARGRGASWSSSVAPSPSVAPSASAEVAAGYAAADGASGDFSRRLSGVDDFSRRLRLLSETLTKTQRDGVSTGVALSENAPTSSSSGVSGQPQRSETPSSGESFTRKLRDQLETIGVSERGVSFSVEPSGRSSLDADDDAASTATEPTSGSSMLHKTLSSKADAHIRKDSSPSFSGD